VHEVALVKYDEACRALAAAKSVDEVQEIRSISEAIRAYAKQAKNKQLEVDATEIRIRAERRLGELMKEQKETVGFSTGGWAAREPSCGSQFNPQDFKPSLTSAGIDKYLADRARKTAAVPADEFEEMMDEWRARTIDEGERVTTNILNRGAHEINRLAHVGQSAGFIEWYTPLDFVDPARKLFGGTISLDPCSSEVANEVIKAEQYYTVDDNGLLFDWHGRIWMNPPYELQMVDPFVTHLSKQYEAGNVKEAVTIVNNATETRWFRILIELASVVAFIHGRVRYWRPHGISHAPLQGQALVYHGPNREGFREVYNHIAWSAFL
jgi:hypothetical protein